MDPISYSKVVKSINSFKKNAESLINLKKYKDASIEFTKISDAYIFLSSLTYSKKEEQNQKQEAFKYKELANQYSNRIESKGNDINGINSNSSFENDDGLKNVIYDLVYHSKISWNDIGGLDKTKTELCFALGMSVAKIPSNISLDSWKNILFFGPPGTGKTLLAAATSNALNQVHKTKAFFYNVKVSSLLSKYFGESAKLISTLYNVARETTPSVIFLDEFESLAFSRDNPNNNSERRILSTLLSELDGLREKDNEQLYVLTIAATNRPWDLDSAILSRFDKQIYVPLPDEYARVQIIKLNLLSKGWELNFDIKELTEITSGLSGREIVSMIKATISSMLIDMNADQFRIEDFDINRLKNLQICTRNLELSDFISSREFIKPQTSGKDLEKFKMYTNIDRNI